MSFVRPPVKPSVVSAEATVRTKLGSSVEDLAIWIGQPYRSGERWICEEHVQGFSQRKVPGDSSLESLAYALTVARIDLEGLITLGYSLSLLSDPSNKADYEVLKKLFGIIPFLK